LALSAFIAFLLVPAAQGEPPPLAGDVYLVLREASTATEARVPGRDQRVLVYDRKYSEAERTPPPRYVAPPPPSFVPLILAGPPAEAPADDRGWSALSVTLARAHVKPLAGFSRAHLGDSVAIVLDGEIIAIHRIRAVIEDGRFVISRCQDNACQVLRSKLSR
jgi:hypothetical protein